MIGVECEKENSGSSWGSSGCNKPSSAKASSTFTGTGYHFDTSVGGTDRFYRFV